MLLALLLVLESFLAALIPLSLKFIIDSGLIERDQRTLAMALGFLAVAGIIVSVGGLFRDYVLAGLQAGVLSDIRSRMFEHAVRLAELPLHHSDPFDRVIIAQAQIEGIPIVTADRQFEAYDVKIVWAN